MSRSYHETFSMLRKMQVVKKSLEDFFTTWEGLRLIEKGAIKRSVKKRRKELKQLKKIKYNNPEKYNEILNILRNSL